MEAATKAITEALRDSLEHEADEAGQFWAMLKAAQPFLEQPPSPTAEPDEKEETVAPAAPVEEPQESQPVIVAASESIETTSAPTEETTASVSTEVSEESQPAIVAVLEATPAAAESEPPAT